MKRFIIGASVAALIAIPAWAMAEKNHHGMRGPEKRAEIEAKVKEHFAAIDTNKDGVITREEADAYKTAKRQEMRDRMFTRLDADKNGQISREEFDASHREGMGEGHGRGYGMRGMHGRGMMGGDLFTKADANSDGKVTLSEATSKALEMFDRADANKDGTVTPEERRAAWKSWMEQRGGKGPAA